MANCQQILQKASAVFSYLTDEMLKQSPKPKDMISRSIEALALLGHATNELSVLRRGLIKPMLRSEYAALCYTEPETSSSLLFGDDLAKRVRDVKETSTLGNSLTHKQKNKFKSSSNYSGRGRDNRRQKPYNSSQRNNKSRQDFLGTKSSHGGKQSSSNSQGGK